ncbi:MAG: hypothetical protein WDM76_06505 [Limisphaerales bacterium]
MNENPTTPSPNTSTDAKANGRRSEINRGFLEEIANARKVAVAAAKPAYTAALAAVDFDITLTDQIEAIANGIEESISDLKNARTARKTMTAQEKAARDELLGVIQPIQTAAKRKFGGDQTTEREAYYIGEPIGTFTLDEVLNAARNIHVRLAPGANNTPPQDVLPGIKPAGDIKKLSDAIEKYGGKNTAQGEQETEAEKAYEAIAKSVGDLAKLRRQVQLAADQAWPWRTPGVAAIRKEFLIPADRPMKE